MRPGERPDQSETWGARVRPGTPEEGITSPLMGLGQLEPLEPLKPLSLRGPRATRVTRETRITRITRKTRTTSATKYQAYSGLTASGPLFLEIVIIDFDAEDDDAADGRDAIRHEKRP